ncbi:MAG: DUF2520 domain-containing protein [Acidimicrobiia bacterium]|nr:MAG: DUF2520 domain-containing protein [Acidimicrobiia bacterium]
MNIAIHGTGRAAGALALAFSRAGHHIVSVSGRSQARREELLAIVSIVPGTPDLHVIAVSDDAIESVASRIAREEQPANTVHVSGAVSVSALDAIASSGVQVGSFHPLQTLPNAEVGAEQLAGSFIGITAPEPLHDDLVRLSESLGCTAFALEDGVKPLYHAAAAAAANFTLAALALSQDLFESADIPFEAAAPLVNAIVTNAFALGPRQALTGPIARGDITTVAKQLDAVAASNPGLLEDFKALLAVTARAAGTGDRFTGLLT